MDGPYLNVLAYSSCLHANKILHNSHHVLLTHNLSV